MPRPLVLPAVALALLLLPLVACGADDPPDDESSSGGAGSASTFSSEQKTGIATYYDATGDGSCSFGKSSDLDVAAFNFPEFAKSASCGSCVSVSGPKGAVTIRIVDSCPGCEKNHIDLSESAFAKIADLKAGRVPITYSTVACEVTGNVSYRVKEGSSKYWTAIQVRNHRIPVAKVEYKKSGAFVEMARSDYNYFIDAKGVGDQPEGIALRVTSADGQVLEDMLPARVEPGKTFPGSAQFR